MPIPLLIPLALTGVSGITSLIGSRMNDYNRTTKRRSLWDTGSMDAGYRPGVVGLTRQRQQYDEYTPNKAKQTLNTIGQIASLGATLTAPFAKMPNVFSGINTPSDSIPPNTLSGNTGVNRPFQGLPKEYNMTLLDTVPHIMDIKPHGSNHAYNNESWIKPLDGPVNTAGVSTMDRTRSEFGPNPLIKGWGSNPAVGTRVMPTAESSYPTAPSRKSQQISNIYSRRYPNILFPRSELRGLNSLRLPKIDYPIKYPLLLAKQELDPYYELGKKERLFDLKMDKEFGSLYGY